MDAVRIVEPDPGRRGPQAFFRAPDRARRANVHLRIVGRGNQRYALLFRDYLLAYPSTAAAYGELERRLASVAPDVDAYSDLRDPACDLIYLAAEEWAADTDWRAGPDG